MLHNMQFFYRILSSGFHFFFSIYSRLPKWVCTPGSSFLLHMSMRHFGFPGASPRQDRDFDQGHRAELHVECMSALSSHGMGHICQIRVAHANAQFVTIGAISYPTNFNVNIYFSIQDDPCRDRGYQYVPHDVGPLIHTVHSSAN